ncbi:phage head spike fiber domain-containing protein [Aeromonas caviae]|uniref:phage head spike fiber domain-containing protein n=1 Tax=Aeromonas caviae TaxID=648 RepID=UPI0038D12938
MAGVWKRDGTVAVTNGNKKVTGTGTTFADTKNGVAKGHLFCITSGTSVDFYEVDYVVSNTELYLVQAYRGTTATGKAYEIITTFSDSVPEFARRLTATLSAYQQQSDAFQALLTSSAATIEVTAPDGTKQTLIPWKRVTSEGEGQAARAKTEADKAAASAALAGGIVEASALPLPDVWAPLSDSLRLITGYGRDVLVGSDVVARMVNFSRSTTATYIGKDGLMKTAAVNEPRFEKEGLLVEGPSTNLVTHSVDLREQSWAKQQAGTGSTPVVTVNYAQAPDGSMTACRLQMNKGAGTSSVDYSGVLHAISGFVAGATHTLSVWLKSANQNSYNIALSLNGQGLTIVAITPEWRRVTITVVLDDPNRYPRLQLRGGLGTSDTADILTWGWQQEALPFASSYIPTNGAAVTRAGDIVTLPWAMNINPSAVTVALNYDLAGNNKLQRLIEYASAVNPRYLVQMSEAGFLESFAGASAVAVSPAPYGAGSTMVAATSRTRHAFKLSGKAILSSTTDGPAQATTVVSIGSGISGGFPIYGHVRNLRIWHRTLTDDQLKAVA